MKNILVFGDSNTWGYDPETGNRLPWGIRWTSILQEKSPGSRIIEEGLCGRTTVFEDAAREGRKGADTLPVILETHTPLDGAIIMLGTNDCKTANKASAEKIGRGMEQCLDILEGYISREKILLLSPVLLGENVNEKDPEFDKNSVRVSKGLKRIYKDIARKHGVGFLAVSDITPPSSADDEHSLRNIIKLRSYGLCTVMSNRSYSSNKPINL